MGQRPERGTLAGRGTVGERRIATRSRKRMGWASWSALVRGEAKLVVRVDKHVKPVLGHPRIRDRLYAAKLLIEHAYGKPPREIQLEDDQPRLTGAQVMADIVELLPRVVTSLPADTREELARL
jgi:hypothetical protein